MKNPLVRMFFLLSLFAAGQVVASAGTADDDSNDSADAVLGLWATDKAEAHVEIYRTDDGRYNGRIVWLKEPFYPEGDPMAGEPRVDRENPDVALRGRPVVGLEMIRGFEFDGDDRWVDGEIYDPENGTTYSSKMWLTDEGSLKVRGYVGISLFGRTTEWTPVLGRTPEGPNQLQPGQDAEGDGADE